MSFERQRKKRENLDKIFDQITNLYKKEWKYTSLYRSLRTEYRSNKRLELYKVENAFTDFIESKMLSTFEWLHADTHFEILKFMDVYIDEIHTSITNEEV